MIRRIIVVGLFLLLLALVSNQSAPPVTAQSPAYEVIQLVNDFRAANGLPALQINGSLMIAAQQQADYMAATGIYSHTGYNGSSPQSRAESAGYVGWVSENIVGGTNLTPQKGLIWWQNSAVHYAALVSTRYTEVGAGYSSGFDQNFYTLVVGRPSDAPPSAAAPAAANNQPQPLQVAPFVAATPAEDGSIVHVVQQGQALWTLAAHYEVPLQDILLYNGLSEDSMVNPGDEVIIRLGEGQAPPPTPTPPTTHIVREGQTLWYIANVYQVELTDLLWFNGLSGDAVLQPGQELTIRLAEGQAPPPTPTPQLTHVVEAGDSLWSLAAIYNIGLDQLTVWNQLTAETVLRIGQELFIRQPPATATPEMVAVAAAPAAASPTPFATQPLIDVTTPPETLLPVAAATSTPIPEPLTADSALPDDLGTFLGIGILVIVGIVFLFLQRQQI